MRRSDIAILVVLMLLSAVNSFGSVLSTSTPEQKAFFARTLENPNAPLDTSAKVFFEELMKEVSNDIEKEAFLAGLSRDAYLSTDAPFEATIQALQSDEFKSLDRVDMGISIVKLGMRYRFIQNTRFVAPNFFENETEFLRLVREVAAHHSLPFNL